MQDFKIPNGLSELGFDRRDVDKLADRATASLKKGAIAPRDPDSKSKTFPFYNIQQQILKLQNFSRGPGRHLREITQMLLNTEPNLYMPIF